MPTISRRDVLKIGAQGLLGVSSVLGIAGLIRFLSFEPDPPPPQQFEVGTVTDFLKDTRTIIKEIPAVLVHTADGFSAIYLTCPHLGCTVESKADGYTCPCHGSGYNLKGQLVQGPAQQGLKLLRVEITPDEKIIIFKG